MAIDRTANIHPSACVSEGAVIGPRCHIGPFSAIGPNVVLGPDVRLKSHVVLTGHTSIGEGTVIFSFACVGEDPQHLKYKGEPTRLIIGKRNQIREGVTLNTGTRFGVGTTRVGDDCLFMTGSHVGHDSTVGDQVIMANQSALGGHCIIEDNVIIGGLSGVHQNTRIGQGALIGAVSMVRHDVIPFGLVKGPSADLAGINIVGLRRQGISNEDIIVLRNAVERLFGIDNPVMENARAVGEEYSGRDLVNRVLAFVLRPRKQALLAPRSSGAG